jgi:hypothetical protein
MMGHEIRSVSSPHHAQIDRRQSFVFAEIHHRSANRYQPVMGAILPLRFVAQIRSPSRTLRSIPVTRARSASAEECTARRSRQRW